MLQLLFDIIENIGEHFATEARRHIIPSKFSSIPQLLQFLDNFQKHIKNRYNLIEQNMDGVNTDMIVFDIFRIGSVSKSVSGKEPSDSSDMQI